MTRITDSRVSFSVNMYQFGVSRAGSWFQPGPVDTGRFGNLPPADVSTTYLQFTALPSTFCLFFFSHDGELPFRRDHDKRDAQKDTKNERDDTAPPPSQRPESPHQLALCFATAERNSFSISDTNVRQSGTLMARQAQSVAEAWNRYAFGPSYATRISDHWSLGASLHGYANVYHATWAANGLTSDSSVPRAITTSYFDDTRGYSIDLSALVGATYHAGNQTLGLSVNAPSLHALGRGYANLSTSYVDPMNQVSSSTILAGKFASYTPLQIHAGWAIEWDTTTLELDGTLSIPVSNAYSADLTGSRADLKGANVATVPLHITETDSARVVANGAIGIEHFTSKSFSVLGGLSTDFTAVPTSALDQQRAWNFLSTRGNRLGASIGVGSYGHGGELLVGFDTSYGWGDRLAVNLYQEQPLLARTPHDDLAIILVVAGSTNTKALERVYDQMRDLVSPENSAAPAPVPSAAPSTAPAATPSP